MLRLSGDALRAQMERVRSFKKRIEYDQEFPIGAPLCEFFGILIGDGCISEYVTADRIHRLDVVISGDKRYEVDYYVYIQRLLRENFNINSYVKKYEQNNTIQLVIRNQQFSNFLLRQGFPKGKKYDGLSIPAHLRELEWSEVKLLVRGLFDTDGTIFARKDEGYRYPHIGLSTKSSMLREQVYDILRRHHYPICFSGQENLVLKGVANVCRWMSDIGLSNPKHLFKYKYWKTHGVLPARLLGG